ncbi:ATP-binding protein [Streptomonospora sp. S1-112]|uniref:ATP-binding protein n=1 Tax=Streptomonospora mangrovi TaxID=2883123 RepID=A0A9X3NKR2_9ACTN|nr:ATP-binding protein [Streptomonospora mangrovi]MDA0565292.1 ATP-binding protein [Streptomonospora mangrovi]
MAANTFPGEPWAVTKARHWLLAALNTAGVPIPEERRSAALLLCSEAATNAILHTTSKGRCFSVHLHAFPGRITVEVEDDGGPSRPTLITAAPTDEHGRGLGLIDHYADEWGPRATGPGIYCVLTWDPRTVTR